MTRPLNARHRRDFERRSWRYHVALLAHRVERRLGRHLTDRELDRLSLIMDPLQLRAMWLGLGGRLEVRDGHLCLSPTLPRRGQP